MGLSYQIFELEDSGLPEQGILPISARKTITMATDVCLEKDSPHCAKDDNGLICNEHEMKMQRNKGQKNQAAHLQ